MKIPFLPLHIVGEKGLFEKDKKLNALRSLTSDVIPTLEQLIITRHEAKVGSSAYGRRKARRKVSRQAHNLKAMMEAA